MWIPAECDRVFDGMGKGVCMELRKNRDFSCELLLGINRGVFPVNRDCSLLLR